MATVHAPTKRKYESGSQRYSKLAPWSPEEEVSAGYDRLHMAIDRLRSALESDPKNVATYAHAVCSRHAEYELARATLLPTYPASR